MADCKDTLRELEAFLDHELSDGALVAIRAHLDGCLDCLQAFDFHAELKTVIARKCCNDEMPAGLMAKIQQCFGDDYLAEDDAPS
jgi:mycothiol system anti-sigma-R factor